MFSSAEDKRVNLTASAGSPAVAMYVLDRDYRVVAQGVGHLETALPAGIYKIRYESGLASSEAFFELPTGGPAVSLNAPASLPQITPAPLAKSSGSLPDEESAVAQVSKEAGIEAGTGSEACIFVDGAAPGLKLYDYAGLEIAQPAGKNVGGRYFGCKLNLNPGCYLLRFEDVDGRPIEQSIVTCAGWQTQVFLSRDSRSGWPNLADAAVFMSPVGEGFHPEADDLTWAETARQQLAQSRPAPPLKRLRDAIAESEQIQAQFKDSAVANEMLRRKFTNPMLGIYAAHLMMISKDVDLVLLRKVADNLRRLIGDHPDVMAIYFWLDQIPEGFTVAKPPMLRTSWISFVNRSRKDEKLIPAGSYAMRIADRLWGSGAWLVWRQPEPLSPTEVSFDVTTAGTGAAEVPPSQNLKLLALHVSAAIGDKVPATFARQIQEERNLSSLECRILTYIANVEYARKLGDIFATTLDKEGSVTRLLQIMFPSLLERFRTYVPTALSKKIQATASDLLTQDKIVFYMGLPQSAVNEAIQRLVTKWPN